MANPNNKLDFDAISFDDVIGDGAPGLDTVKEAPQDVEAADEIENELDEDIRERGDEDYEDYEDYDDDSDDE